MTKKTPGKSEAGAMVCSVSDAEKWHSIRTALYRDTHPGARLISRNLLNLRRIHECKPNSTLLLVGGEFEDQWHGIAGAYASYNILTITFLYVRPRYRGDDVLFGLFQAIHEFGKHHYYAYLRVPCPVVEELESLHNLFAVARDEMQPQEHVLPDGTKVITYLVPRGKFEQYLP